MPSHHLPYWFFTEILSFPFKECFFFFIFSEEFVEKCKNDDVLDEMFKELAKYYPGIGKVFLNERDIYLTYSLQVAAAAKLPDRFPGIF